MNKSFKSLHPNQLKSFTTSTFEIKYVWARANNSFVQVSPHALVSMLAINKKFNTKPKMYIFFLSKLTNLHNTYGLLSLFLLINQLHDFRLTLQNVVLIRQIAII